MLYDKDGKLLWIADETGAHEILHPGGGFNGRTREPGEPDWWVVAKDPKWQPPGMMLASAPEEGSADSGSPTGGGWGGGSPDWSSLGKLAGADSEAGRKGPPAEPWTLFLATQEHLDHLDKINGFGEAVQTIGAGIGEAVSKGWDATGQALGKTWDARNNEDLKKGVEFGGKAAWEVTKDVAGTVFWDGLANTGDTTLAEGAEQLGFKRAARAFGNPAVTVPLNKAISAGRLVKSVWGGGAEADTKDLGKRIDTIYEDVYGRRR